MSHRPSTPPPRRTRLDQIVYAFWAFVVAGLAVLSVLAACEPPLEEDAQRPLSVRTDPGNSG